MKAMVSDELGSIDAAEINSILIGVDEEGRQVVVRPGRYGPYLKRGDDTASVPEDLAPDELTLEKCAELLAAPRGDREVGADPLTGLMVFAKAGRFGPYVQLGEMGDVVATMAQPIAAEPATGKKPKAPKKVKAKPPEKPKSASLFKHMTVDTITLEEALQLLSLPRVVGIDPGDNAEIVASNGRFGPYLRKGTDSRSLVNEEQLLTVTLDEALALYALPKERRGRGQAVAKPPLAEVGPDPVSGQPMVVKEGRFGPYVTDGETNASLRKGDDPETLTVERGAELLADRRARVASEPKRTIKKGGARKTAAKKR